MRVMTTSETGRSINSLSTLRNRQGQVRQLFQRGFSLLELLMVIFIIGLVYGVVTVSISTVGADPLDKQIERLRYSVQVGQTEAIVRSQPVAIGFTHTGYRFYTLKGKAWQVLESERLLQAYTLPDHVDAELMLEGISVVLTEAPPEKPHVFILPTGESSPFVYQLQAGGERRRIRFNALGQVVAGDEANE